MCKHRTNGDIQKIDVPSSENSNWNYSPTHNRYHIFLNGRGRCVVPMKISSNFLDQPAIQHTSTVNLSFRFLWPGNGCVAIVLSEAILYCTPHSSALKQFIGSSPEKTFCRSGNSSTGVYAQRLRPHHENNSFLAPIGVWSWRSNPPKSSVSVQRDPHNLLKVSFVEFVPARELFLQWCSCARWTNGRCSHKVDSQGGRARRSFRAFSLQCGHQVEWHLDRLEWFARLTFVRGGMGEGNSLSFALP